MVFSTDPATGVITGTVSNGLNIDKVPITYRLQNKNSGSLNEPDVIFYVDFTAAAPLCEIDSGGGDKAVDFYASL